jgi:hypothetical protein
VRRTLCAALALAPFLPLPLRAQLPTGPQAELRAEAYYTRAVLGGVGLVVPIGTYARLGGVVAGGAYLDTPREPAARADALIRFHFDPLRQSRRALYGAAGVSAMLDQDGRWRPYLLARLGVEGSAKAGWMPAAELGLGGGAHIALVMRRARARGR